MLSADALGNPLDRIEFAAGATVIVAVSGGSDSTALLHLLKDTLDRRAVPVHVIAATVDHGLREGSAGEARTVAAQCAAAGIEHHVLAWEGPKPPTGLQEAARHARHALLAGLAEASRATAVLVGHTRDDLAETVIMRRRRGEGPGLSGIAPATLFRRKVWFVRPLLRTSRASLRRWLADRSIGWIEDPSNDNPDFERVALRKALAIEGDQEARIAEAVGLAGDSATERIATAEDAARLMRAHVRFEGAGRFRLGRGMLGQGEPSLHALRIVLAAAGGKEQLPDLPRSRELLAAVTRAGAGARFSLSRAVIEARSDGIAIRREARRGGAGVSGSDLPSPWGRFLPCFEIEPATALAELAGDPIPPPLPWKIL